MSYLSLRLRRCAVLGALAVAVQTVPLLHGGYASAAPYASGVTETPSGTVSFVLNESDANVVIRRDGVATPLGTNLAKGVHTFERNGASTYHIEVSKAAPSGWTLTSTDTTDNNFELPRGVAVNKNPSVNGAPNPLFGRVYVSNARNTSTAAGKTMVDGVYGLNAALVSLFNDRTGGVAWQTTTSTPADNLNFVSPWHLEVGPDDRLYIADWSDAHSGLWSTDPDVLTNVEVLASGTRAVNGLTTNHGSISDVIIKGTANNKTIYVTDEDFAAGQRGVYAHALGSANSTAATPTTVVADVTNRLQNGDQNLAIASDGTYWVSQLRAAPSATDPLPSLVQFAADGTLLFDSSRDLGGGFAAQDPLRDTRAIAYDPVNDLLALVTSRTGGNGLIIIFDDDTKTILTSFAFGNGTTNTDVAFDAAGNLYVTNRSAERLRVWSPGGNTTWTTGSDGSFFQGVVPEPASLTLLGAAGVLALRRRRR